MEEKLPKEKVLLTWLYNTETPINKLQLFLWMLLKTFLIIGDNITAQQTSLLKGKVG